MQLLIRMVLIVLMLLVAGCASMSEKQYQQAEKSITSGDYSAAFDFLALALKSDIKNYEAIVRFSDIAETAYKQKLDEIKQAKISTDWDRVAYGYDKIIAMNQSLSSVQSSLTEFATSVRTTKERRAAMKRILAMQQYDVIAQRRGAYEHAAQAHYFTAKSYLNAKAYRQSQHRFEKALSFIPDYKNAEALLAKARYQADLLEAKKKYREAELAVSRQKYRDASEAYFEADRLIPGFRKALKLAQKYKEVADLEDATRHYNEGNMYAEQRQYRMAETAFRNSASFVPGFRDAMALAVKYKHLADLEDAHSFYEQGEQLMARDDFKHAAQAFEKANQYIPGFRDSLHMAELARSFVPPNQNELKRIIQHSVTHGIPLNWLHDEHRGVTEEVRITHVRVIRQGRFNHHRQLWPYRLR